MDYEENLADQFVVNIEGVNFEVVEGRSEHGDEGVEERVESVADRVGAEEDEADGGE